MHHLLTDALQTAVAANTQSYKYTNTQRYKNKYTNFEFREILHQLLTDAVQTGVVVTCDCKLLCKCKLHFKWNLKCKLQRLQSGVE